MNSFVVVFPTEPVTPTICEAFAAGGPLAIHVLGEAQEDLSNRFARGGADKWADLAYGAGEHGAPSIGTSANTDETDGSSPATMAASGPPSEVPATVMAAGSCAPTHDTIVRTSAIACTVTAMFSSGSKLGWTTFAWLRTPRASAG